MIYASPAVNKSITTSPGSPSKDLERRFIFQQSISLDTVFIKSLEDTPSLKNAFQIFVGEKSFTVYAATPVDKEFWLSDLRELAPVVIPEINQNDKIQNCMICKKAFNSQKVSYSV